MRLINRRPGPPAVAALAALPFVAVALIYASASAARRAENPQDRLLPAPAQILDTAGRLLFEPDRRTGDILFWIDTAVSLQRLGLGVGIAALTGLVIGLAIGLLPLARAGLASFVEVLSLIPPLAVLPILFLLLGLGETAKVALIAIGITPFLIRDMAGRTAEIPPEQIVKAQTLGASSLAIALRVALPQVMPRLIQSVRLALGPAWLFLIAAEAIASEAGLGYRIFLVRRFLAMDVILVYVAWITLLAFLIDRLLRYASRRFFPWAETA
ncbi:ABC transporter permease [Histidinibacterium lentulum]|uniref:ABC transporter permease subunit n=1 Tax=Histidinibacterium lentulum TaxID=2480588 RepID=A0A3N2QRG0_9RHOB|nr:ABC transporter permease subunit [Histidinibacterium lentulum]ROT97792.1 ABC transporter permease subunit [Histidinibacterium lentulum]